MRCAAGVDFRVAQLEEANRVLGRDRQASVEIMARLKRGAEEREGNHVKELARVGEEKALRQWIMGGPYHSTFVSYYCSLCD